MQKKLIALAIAGLASVPAFAQSNVTIYGRADAGWVNSGGDSGGIRTNGNKNEVASGIGGGSRFGLRGTEDLGNGLKAIFQMEYNVQLDSASIAAANVTTNPNPSGLRSRNAWVGLTGNFGTALIGRVDGARYGVATKYDPFGSGYVGNMASLQTHATRADNALVYVTPSWGGFKIVGAYTTQLIGQESTAGAQTTTGVDPVAPASANRGDLRLWAILPSYENGPISVTFDYEEAKNKDLPDTKIKLYVVGGSYDFGVVKLHGYWEKAKSQDAGAAPATGNGYIPVAGADNWDQRSWMLGLSAPLMGGKTVLRTSYVRLDDRTATDVNGRQLTGDCHKWGIGASYFLSKRTSVFADYAKISNKSQGTCTITVSGAAGSFDGGGGTGPAGGFGVRGFDLGIAHTF